MPLNGLRSVPLPFNEADSILDENAADLVQQQLQRGESLQSICEAISSSYEGYPDMIRMVLSWGERIGIPSEGLLREATVCALRDHESKVVGYVEQHNGECWPRTRKATRRLLCDELWRPELLDMAGRHPATIFARGVLNERMLHDSQVDGDVFESSATVAQQVLSLLDSLRDYSINNSTASGDSAELQRKIEWTCDVIAKISWNEEISGCTVMDTLQNCSNHSPDPLVRLTCVKAMKTTINYLSTMITQTKLERKESLTGKQRTKAVLPNGTGYNDMKESTLVLSMKMMFVVSAAQLNARFWNPALFDAVIGLLDSNTRVTTRPTLAAKRRMDRHFVTLTKTIHALVGVIRLTARESASNAAKGNGLGNGFTNGKKKGADENSDDDLEVDVVETETETETTMPMGMKVLFLRWLAAPQMMASVTAALFTGDGPTTASHGSGLGHMGMTPSPLVMTNGIGANFAGMLSVFLHSFLQSHSGTNRVR